MFKNGEVIIDEEMGTTMLNCLLKLFKAADAHQEWESVKSLDRNDSRASEISKLSHSE